MIVRRKRVAAMIRHKLRSHRRPLPPVVLGVGLLLIMRATAAATFDKLEVTQHESQYQISGEVYLNATPQQVYSLLTDCRRLPEINPNVRVSEVRKVINIHNQLVYTETQVCVLIFAAPSSRYNSSQNWTRRISWP